jgi:hypothetical protein
VLGAGHCRMRGCVVASTLSSSARPRRDARLARRPGAPRSSAQSSRPAIEGTWMHTPCWPRLVQIRARAACGPRNCSGSNDEDQERRSGERTVFACRLHPDRIELAPQSNWLQNHPRQLDTRSLRASLGDQVMTRSSRGLAAVLLAALFVGAPWAAYHLHRAGWSEGAITLALTPVALVVVMIARRLLYGPVVRRGRSDQTISR